MQEKVSKKRIIFRLREYTKDHSINNLSKEDATLLCKDIENNRGIDSLPLSLPRKIKILVIVIIIKYICINYD